MGTGSRGSPGRSRTSAAARRGRSILWCGGPATGGRRRESPTTPGTAAPACPIASLRQRLRARPLVYLIIRGRHDQPRDDEADRNAGGGANRVRRHGAGGPFVRERDEGWRNRQRE